MTSGGSASTAAARRPTGDQFGAHQRRLLLVSAAASLVLSPLTAVWALVVGPLLVLIGWAGGRNRSDERSRATSLFWVGLGILLGVLPYFLLAALQT